MHVLCSYVLYLYATYLRITIRNIYDTYYCFQKRSTRTKYIKSAWFNLLTTDIGYINPERLTSHKPQHQVIPFYFSVPLVALAVDRKVACATWSYDSALLPLRRTRTSLKTLKTLPTPNAVDFVTETRYDFHHEQKNPSYYLNFTSFKKKTNRGKMGKVHGSLARAGKVKSQTPKVGPSFIHFFFWPNQCLHSENTNPFSPKYNPK